MNSALPPLDAQDLNRAFDTIEVSDWLSLSGKSLFITGGTGFIGKWLLSTLLDANQRLDLNCRITILSRTPNLFSAAMPRIANAANVTLLTGDVRNFAPPGNTFDIVIHAATDVIAQTTPRQTFSTCVDGTRQTLELAARSGASQFLLLSSGAVYGPQPHSLDRTPESFTGGPDPLAPSSAYGEGKRVAEWLACCQATESKLQVKIARIYAQIGPYLPLDKHFAIGNFLRDALRGHPIVIRSDGTPRRSWMHAADMAGWLLAVLIRGRSGIAYNVGGNESISMAEAATRISQAVNSTSNLHIIETPKPGAPPDRYVPDIRRALTELRLPPPLTFDEAVVRTAHWFRSHKLSA